MENEHTALTGTTTTITITKKKPGSTPLVVVSTFAITLLLGLALLYAGLPIRRRGSLAAAAGSGGTTRGGAITAASLTLMSKKYFAYNPSCELSVGSYVSNEDYCFTCGSGGSLTYCWNNQECPPNCDWNGVGSIGDGNCGAPCENYYGGGP